jgi:hypothetical protein
MNTRQKRRWAAIQTHYPIHADIAKEFKADARYFLRLDLSYLAAAAVLVGVLKITPHQIPGVAVALTAVIILYCVLLVVDTATYSMAHEHWIAAKMDRLTRCPQWIVRAGVSHQPWLHILFIGVVITGGFAYASGMHHGREERTAVIEIQSAIDSFFAVEKRYPRSIKELTEKDPTVNTSIRNLNGEWFDYQPVGTDSYRLRFAWGKKPDDGAVIMVFTPQLNFKKIAAEADKEMDD